MSLTIDENGKALTETQDGVTFPVEYSFACVNDYVHTQGRTYEELESLCLGMASEIDRLKNKLIFPAYCLKSQPVNPNSKSV